MQETNLARDILTLSQIADCMMRRIAALIAMSLWFVHGQAAEVRAAEVRAAGFKAAKQLRRPVDLVATETWVYVANRDSGTISVVDPTTRSVVNEWQVGRRLSSLLRVTDRLLVAADEDAGEIVWITVNGKNPGAKIRQAVAPYPVDLAIAPDGKTLAVTSLWSWRLTLLDVPTTADVEAAKPLPNAKTVDLPFAVRCQNWSPTGDLLVIADAFGGRLILLNPANGEIAIASLEGHNIRGMGHNSDRDALLVTHQMLNEQVPTTRPRVFWGAVMGNVIRSISWKDLAKIHAQQKAQQQPTDIGHWMMYPLGQPSDAAGDPSDLMSLPNQITLVAISGTNEVAIRKGDRQLFSHTKVGRRPVAIDVTPSSKRAFVANYFDDSITRLDLTADSIASSSQSIPLGPRPDMSQSELGEQLFYDASLSLDNWYSCHSCHTDGHTNGRRNDNLSDHSYGAPKRILSLLGTESTSPWAWNGSQTTLFGQIEKSINETMQGHEKQRATDNNVHALVAYVETLKPAPSVHKLRGTLDQDAMNRGSKLFESKGCVTCHHRGNYTSPDLVNVGLQDESKVSEFNPPSLLGYSQKPAFFHDASANTLRDVLNAHAADSEVSDSELTDIEEFLKSL